MNTARFGTLLVRRLAYDQRVFSGVRCLYTPQFLNLDKYIEAREMTQNQYGSMKENFLKRMKQQIENNESQMVFTDDLKSIIHLCEGTSNDLDLCTKMIKKFHAQNRELRFGTFIFGPVVMRMLYHLQATDLALQLIKDKEIDGFFDQLKSFFVVMDLLFEQKRYQDILDLNDILQEKKLHDTKFPRDCFVLTCAACYKLNTPESYNYAINLIRDARTSGADIIHRALHFAVALALNQNKPDVAMELHSSLLLRNNIIANNLKIVILAKINRVQDAFQFLQAKVQEDLPSQATIRGDICQSSLDELQKVVETLGDTEKTHQFEQLCRSLKEGVFITTQTVDELMLVPVTPRPNLMQGRPGFGYGDQQQFRRPYDFRQRDNDFPTFQRREPLRRQASDQQRPRMPRSDSDEDEFPTFQRRPPFRQQSSDQQRPRMSRNEFDNDEDESPTFRRGPPFRHQSSGGSQE